MNKKKKAKFRWGTVDVFSYERSDNPCPMKSLILGDIGLSINQYDPVNPKGKYVSVTHINTGKRLVTSFNSSVTARQFCEAVSELVNWNLIKDDKNLNQTFPGLGVKIRLMRDIVVEYKVNWRSEVVERMLLNGGLEK